MEVMGVGEEMEGWRREEEAGLNGPTMVECTRVQAAGRFTLSVSLIYSYDLPTLTSKC